jgi:cation diffusion facilitator family transporter
MGKLFGHIPAIEWRAAMISVVTGITLLILKFVAYFMTGSAAVFSDAMESIVNVVASGVAAYSLYLAHAPADREHPYGHGKMEFMSGAFEGGMIMLAAIVIFFKTIDGVLFHQMEVQQLGLGLALMVVAMFVNGAVGLYLVATGKQRGSLTLEADGYHLLSDAITSIATTLALLIVRIFNWPYADPITAVLIVVYIAWMGAKLLRRSAAGLMDEQDQADGLLLERILNAHVGPAARQPRICSYHKLRHRHSGRYHWIDFHIMVHPKLNVEQGHAIASAIEYEIEQAVVEGKATAHVEPCLEAGCEL